MKLRRGFTIIEVSLFLAITAILFVGITVGTNNSINQQRYSDSVNSFADFLRNVYSEVSNPQSFGSGNSDQALYGKLISFGQTTNIYGGSNNEGEIYVYDVIGNADGKISSGTYQEALKDLNATLIAYKDENNTGSNSFNRTYQMPESYIPKWQSRIEGTEKGKSANVNVLIVRHPKSGTISTFVSTDKLDINSDIKSLANKTAVLKKDDGSCLTGEAFGVCSEMKSAVTKITNTMSNIWKSFTYDSVDFCVNPFSDSSRRQNVRIAKGARNSSGVEILDLDDTNNICNKE